MEEKYLIWHIEGGLGKNVAATSLIGTLNETYPDRKIIVVASWPDIFLNHSGIYRVYRIGATQYFYDDFIKDKNTIIFKHEPYSETGHILNNKHLIASWCKLMDIEYSFQKPVINFNFVQKRNFKKWDRPKPILLIQTNGGYFDSDNEYSWTRDMPFLLALNIADKYRDTHHIIQVCKKKSLKIPDAEILDQQMPPIELFSLVACSDKRFLIDSCLQHASAAFDLESTVFWVGTSPKRFGYPLHNNIVAKKPKEVNKLSNSYLYDYSFEGVPYECPYMDLDEMFDISKIMEQI
jgi:hypothetical protein